MSANKANAIKQFNLAQLKVVLGLISILLPVLILYGCSIDNDEKDYHANGIDLDPILKLNLPTKVVINQNDLRTVIDLEKLEELDQVAFQTGQPVVFDNLDFIYRIQDEPTITFGIMLFAHNNIKDAHAAFQRVCDDSKYNFSAGEVSDVLYYYCVSDLKMARKGEEGFRKPLGVYDSTIYIQKGTLTIRISESTETLDRTLSNEAIEHIATFFKTVDSVEE